MPCVPVTDPNRLLLLQIEGLIAYLDGQEQGDIVRALGSKVTQKEKEIRELVRQVMDAREELTRYRHPGYKLPVLPDCWTKYRPTKDYSSSDHLNESAAGSSEGGPAKSLENCPPAKRPRMELPLVPVKTSVVETRSYRPVESW